MKMICATLWTTALQILLAIAVGEAKLQESRYTALVSNAPRKTWRNLI
jgi:hypothetical protein